MASSTAATWHRVVLLLVALTLFCVTSLRAQNVQPAGQVDSNADTLVHTLEGVVKRVADTYLIVQAKRIEVIDKTEFRGIKRLEDVPVGAQIEVQYVHLKSGEYVALRITYPRPESS